VEIVAYTGVFGGYDTLRPTQYPEVCFTDGAVNDSPRWSYRSIFSGRDPKWANRQVKLQAHRYIDADISIYHDGNVRMTASPEEIAAHLGPNDIAVYRHPEGRNCIYSEAQEVIRQHKSSANVVNEQMDRYRAEGYPKRNGLAACYVLVRRHTPQIEQLNNRWWREYERGAKRDQLSFDYVCWKLGVEYSVLPGNLFEGTSSLFERNKHRRVVDVRTTWRNAYGKQVIMAEREYLVEAASDIADRFEDPLMVNIGIFRYATMYCLRAGAPDARLIGIDIKEPDVGQGDLGAEIIIGDSAKIHDRVSDPVHLLFIDGDHRYRGVRADLAAWTPKVASGGLVVMHDYAPRNEHLVKLPILEGVRRAAMEWYENAEGWEQIQAPGSLAAFRSP
jgi:hypothetical protein